MPFLQEYGNISYHVDRSAAAQSVPLDASTSNVHTEDFNKHDKKSKKGAKNDSMKPVMPIISIDMPD